MKSLFALTSMLLLNSATFASEKVTVETIQTCQQDDGDQWIEVGIVAKSNSEFELLLVAHDEDDNSATLVATKQVTAAKCDDQVCYQNKEGSVRLDLFVETNFTRANFFSTNAGSRNSIEQTLECYGGVGIGFDRP